MSFAGTFLLMRLLQPRAKPRPATIRGRSIVLLALFLLALAVAVLAPAGAVARATSERHSACSTGTSRQRRHAKKPGSHCTTRRSSRRGGSTKPIKHTRPAKKGARTGTSSKKATPALCEDGSLPLSESAGFTCADGSDPFCENGSEPQTAPGGRPLCESTEDDGGECSAEVEECEAQEGCEAPTGGSETALACEIEGGEASSAGEAERAQLSSVTRRLRAQ